jgi:hypothetical protein
MNVYVALGAWVLVVHKASIATWAGDSARTAHKILTDEPDNH